MIDIRAEKWCLVDWIRPEEIVCSDKNCWDYKIKQKIRRKIRIEHT